jgi:hypothetical protein
MPTPLRKEIPSEERITVRLTGWELASLEARAGVKKNSGYAEGRVFADYVRGLLGLPPRPGKVRRR